VGDKVAELQKKGKDFLQIAAQSAREPRADEHVLEFRSGGRE
jgi:hypothetical protein